MQKPDKTILVALIMVRTTLTQPKEQLSWTQKGNHRLCDLLWPLTSEPGPTHDSTGGLVSPGLSPTVKDNIQEALTPPNEVTAEVTA